MTRSYPWCMAGQAMNNGFQFSLSREICYAHGFHISPPWSPPFSCRPGFLSPRYVSPAWVAAFFSAYACGDWMRRRRGAGAVIPAICLTGETRGGPADVVD